MIRCKIPFPGAFFAFLLSLLTITCTTIPTKAPPLREISPSSLSPAPVSVVQQPEMEISFPAQSDWVDYGIILDAGEEGNWDYYLWGGFAFSIIKMDA